MTPTSKPASSPGPSPDTPHIALDLSPTAATPQGRSASALNPQRAAVTRLLQFDKTIVRASGCHVYDSQGRAYLDFSSQYGVLAFGHNPAFLWDILQQVRHNEEPSFVQPLVAPAAEQLAQLLSDLSPGGPRIAVLCNSGAEAAEAAIKLARARTGRPLILATDNSFHGKTLGAASATGTAAYRAPFGADTTQFAHIPYDDLGALAQRLAQGDVAAFMVEPVQGEGGMVTPSAGYLLQAQALCRQHGTLFVVDEVQTGMGRTGKLFASEWDALDPDVLLLAKALGGGLVPIAACLVAERAWHRDMGLYHSSTFANNQLTCRIAVRTLQALTDNHGALLNQVQVRAAYLRARLEELVLRYPKAFQRVRGRGLLLGLELSEWPGEAAYFIGMVNARGFRVPLVSGHLLNAHGLLVLPTISRSHVLRIQPPLVVTPAQIDQAVAALDATGRLIQEGRFAQLISYTTGGQADPDAPLAVPTPLPTPVPMPVPLTERLQPMVPAAPKQAYLGRFAFLMHPMDMDDMVRCMPSGCENYPPEQAAELRRWIQRWHAFDSSPTTTHFLPRLASRAGGYVDGWLISCMLPPRDLMRLRPAERNTLMQQYLQAAHSVGANTIGLGAFTSVITRGGLDIANSQVPLTTGNSLTAMVCVQGLVQAADRLGRPLHQQTVAIIGATGSVGRLAALEVAAQCRALVLFGNPGNPSATDEVHSVAGEIYQELLRQPEAGVPGAIRGDLQALRRTGPLPTELLNTPEPDACRELAQLIAARFSDALGRRAPIQISVDLQSHLRLAQAILCATSQGKPFVQSDWIADDTIVCDAARPGDVGALVRKHRKDLFVFDGGLVQLPERVAFGRNNVLGFAPGINLACLSETMALTMAQTQRHHSLGRRIPLDEARSIHALARHHGFECHVPQQDVLALTQGHRARHTVPA